MTMGRPRRYKSPEELGEAIDAYFAEHKEDPTITGLALHLGFLSRQAINNYEGYSAEFHDVVKRAKLRVECSYEVGLRKQACAGSIFALKNMGQPWTDKQELTGKDGAALLPPQITVMPQEEK